MTFKLPDLPYKFNALEPAIDAQTMELHHDKHHATYVTKLNGALEGKNEWLNMDIKDVCRKIGGVPADIRTAVRNNGGGHYNHTLFWELMAPKDKVGTPSGELQRAIDDNLGGMDKFKKDFEAAGLGRFGSGWAWLIVNDQGKLQVVSTPNQDNPLMKGVAETTGEPILGVDVWEHAYYLKYQNRRNEYLSAWWDVVNWNKVNELFAQEKK